MPRNSSGTYSLPLPAYVAGTTITSSAMNTNLSDIATALTGSLASNGVTPMTGPLQLSAGTLGAPSLTLVSDATTGFYNSAAGSLTYVAAGVATVVLSGTGLSTTNFSASGNVTITGTLTTGAQVITGATVPLVVRNTTNDALEHTIVTLGLGSGGGDVYGITALGTGANDVTQVRHYIGATEIYRFTATTYTFAGNVAIGAAKSLTFGTTISINGAGYIDVLEIVAPAAPAANTARIFSADFGGVTCIYYQDSAGVINAISPPGSVVGRGYGEYTGTTVFSGTIPKDNSKPQSGEGDQIVTATITLQKSTNRVRARFNGFAGIAGSVIPDLTVALFCSTSVDAINVCNQVADNDAGTTNYCNVMLEVEHAPASVGPLTYQVRAGNAGNNYSFNGNTGGGLYGGSARAVLILEEIQV